MHRRLFGITGTDLFFVFQIAMAYIFAVPQFAKMLTDVRGVSVTWLLFAQVFVVLNLLLTIGAYRHTRTRETFQAICIYANWTVVNTPLIILAFLKCRWSYSDSVVSAGIFVSALAVVWWGKGVGKPMGHPYVRGLLVGIFRVVPHCYLIYCIFSAGSASGIAGITILGANITASARVLTLYLAGRKSAWESGIRASFVSELSNEGSWLLVSCIWLFYH